jgi:hypothetical protein
MPPSAARSIVTRQDLRNVAFTAPAEGWIMERDANRTTEIDERAA